MLFAAGWSWFHALGLTDGAILEATGLSALSSADHSGTTLFAHAMFVTVLLTIFALVARAGIQRARQRSGLEKYFPDESMTPRNMAEMYAQGVLSLSSDIISKADARLFFAIPGALFLYIFLNNLLGLVPGLLPPTDNINTNVGIAIIAFAVSTGIGLKRDFGGFFKHMWGPITLLGFLLFPVELISLFIRPVSLSLRLTGNMFGDHTVFSVMSGLVPLGVPTIFLGLATFVSFMQAFIFSVLTVVYIGLSVPHHDDDHH